MPAVRLDRPLNGMQADGGPLDVSPAGWFGITFATFWIALLGHEAAHFAVAHFVYSTRALSGGNVTPHQELLVVGAGPTFTLAMIVACAAGIRSHRAARAAGAALRQGRAIAVAAIAFGVSRIVVIAPATLLNLGTNDERTVAQILNIFPALLWTGEALVVVAAVVFVARGGALPRRRGSLAAIAAALVAGWLSAVTIGRAIGLPI